MKQDNCIFCMLANGDIPTNTIYEDEDFRVIMDNAPATKGHALVLPKNHYADIYEIDSEILGKAIQVGQKVIKHVTPIPMQPAPTCWTPGMSLTVCSP